MSLVIVERRVPPPLRWTSTACLLLGVTVLRRGTWEQLAPVAAAVVAVFLVVGATAAPLSALLLIDRWRSRP